MADLQRKPDVFLSSAFLGFENLRQEILSLDPGRIWLADDRSEFDTRKGVPRFAVMDALVERVRRSDAIICVLRDRYGTSAFGDTEDAESVSFFEVEIYQAALFHNNVHVFLLEPFNPDDRLKGLLDVINAVRPGLIPTRTVPTEQLLDGVKRVLDAGRPRRGRRAISLRSLVTELAGKRGHPKPDIQFLDGVFRPVSKRPDRDHVDFLLNDVMGETSIEKRLTRMWIALRELSAAPYGDEKYADYRGLWDAALTEWASASAWYGLHGHLYAGRLAAVNSLLQVRELAQRRDVITQREAIQGTKGGRASEYYSIAKMMRTEQRREHYLRCALDDINEALSVEHADPSGFLSIRGHIYRAQGKLADALGDFEAMRVLRQHGEPGRLGEALSDIGLVTMELRGARAAKALLHEGRDLLRTAGRHPFAIRAQKRLAVAELKTGHPVQALRELCDAHDQAQEHQIFGQITPLMEWTHALARHVGLWSRRR